MNHTFICYYGLSKRQMYGPLITTVCGPPTSFILSTHPHRHVLAQAWTFTRQRFGSDYGAWLSSFNSRSRYSDAIFKQQGRLREEGSNADSCLDCKRLRQEVEDLRQQVKDYEEEEVANTVSTYHN